jgi:hypothetical protein
MARMLGLTSKGVNQSSRIELRDIALRRGVDESGAQLRQVTDRVGLLQQLEVELTTIAAGAATMAQETVGAPVRARSASKRYTMEGEREVQRAALGETAGDASRPESEGSLLGGTIELF